jgi:hypothetical protein
MAAMALAYSQVNASRGGCVSGDQSSLRPVLKSGPAGLFSVQCSQRGMADKLRLDGPETIKPQSPPQSTLP